VRDDERQRIFMFRTNVDEMNVQPIDLSHELRQGVQFRLDLASVVICRPIAREFLNRRELHTLRHIRDRFPFRPLCPAYVPAQFGKFRFRNVHMKRTNIQVVNFTRIITYNLIIIHNPMQNWWYCFFYC
jgi:hypothetical protein